MDQSGKIFGIGLSKTGTTSLFVALHQLGYRSATFRHMELMGLDAWRNGDFEPDYFAHFDAVTDLPVGTFFRELDDRYPGSKFILTVRDEDAWMTSAERQFSIQKKRSDYYRQVQTDTYGTVEFDGDLFRETRSRHEADVMHHFADRPDDLLIMDLANGDGWTELCTFLDKPVPTEPFPKVRPGFTPPVQLGDTANTTTIDKGRFAFVLPLVSPTRKNVEDYAIVERCLKASLQSYLSIDHDDVHAVVVCHKTPDWAHEFRDRVSFLNVGEHALFQTDRGGFVYDKGKKYIIGSLYATQVLQADHIMLADADDFVRNDLTRRLAEFAPGRDGFNLTRGYHAYLNADPEHFLVRGLFEVFEFDRTCGTCRIFPRDSLTETLDRAEPKLRALMHGFSIGTIEVMVPDAIMDQIAAMESEFTAVSRSIFWLLGHHTKLQPEFQFAEITEPMVAKGCGHGNHVGPNAGEIHWHRICKSVRPKQLLDRFGGQAELLRAAPSLAPIIRGWAYANIIVPRQKVTNKRKRKQRLK